MIENDAIERYLNQVKQNLYNITIPDNFIEDIRNSLTDYVESNPDCSFDDLVNQFGNPEYVAGEFLDNTVFASPQNISKGNKKRKAIIFILLAFIISLATSFIYMTTDKTAPKADKSITIYKTIPTDNSTSSRGSKLL